MVEDYIVGLYRSIVFDGIGLCRKSLKELFIRGPCTRWFSLPTLLRIIPALTHLYITTVYTKNWDLQQQEERINE